jgi:diacylglycerol O-acyltransferase
MQLTQSVSSPDPDFRMYDLPMSQTAYQRHLAAVGAKRERRVVPKERELRAVAEALKEQFDSSAHILGALRRFGGAFFGRSGNLAVPWHNVPRTPINTRVDGARRFVAQSWSFDRIKAVCTAIDGTVNDVVLAMCSGALRRYLLGHHELPRHSLKAMAPVSLREKGDYSAGNAVGFITADLATNIEDPELRIKTIQKSMQAGKALLQGMSRREASLFMQLTQLPALLTSALGLAARFPAFSTVISNVPGPREQLYWNGARLDGIYPASIVFDGFAMNITLVSYARSLDFGIVACRRSLPEVQRMIDYLEEALLELEDVAGLRSSGSKRKTTGRAAPGNTKSNAASKSKAKSQPKAKTKTKTKAKAKAKARSKPKAKARSKTNAKARLKPKSRPTARSKASSKAGVRPKLKSNNNTLP